MHDSKRFLCILCTIFLGTLAWLSQAHAAFSPVVNVNSNASSDTGMDHDDRPSISRGPDGTWVAVWVGTGPNGLAPNGNDAGSPTSNNEDIYLARSLDNGKTWSEKATLKTNAATDNADDLEPSVTNDGKGHWMVVWRSKDSLNNTIGFDEDILMAYSADNGVTWSDPSPVNNDSASDGGSIGSGITAVDWNPTVCSDGDGHWMVAWTQANNRTGAWVSSARVAVSSDAGAHWSAPLTLQSRTDVSSMYHLLRTTVATDRNGIWIATWVALGSTQNDYDIYFSRSSDNGAHWTTPAFLNSNANNDNGTDDRPQLTTDGQGHWLAVWDSTYSLSGTIGTDLDILFATSTDNGQSWSQPAPLNRDAATDIGTDEGVSVIYDGAGKWVAGWGTNKLGGDIDYYYATLPVGQTQWSTPAMINPWANNDSTADKEDNYLCLASAAPGCWLACWSSAWDLSSNSLGGDSDIFLTMFDPSIIPAPNIVAEPAMLKFINGTGLEVDVTKGNPPTTATLTIKNDGTAPLTLKGLQFNGPHADDFWILQMPAIPTVLAPDASCQMVIQFKPTETQATFSMLGNLVLYSNDPDQPYLTVPLIGDAVPAELTGFTAE